jgi:hypothetical protein
MGKFYIINVSTTAPFLATVADLPFQAPYLFSTVWSLIKPWLDEVTVSKISILGKNYQSELLKQIPAENLPTDFGGKCSCAGGCSLSDAGPWNPARH